VGALKNQSDLMPKNAKVVELISPLPFEECCRQLLSAMDRPFSLFPTHRVAGRLIGHKLRAKKSMRAKSAAWTKLVAELIEHEGGTLIVCRVTPTIFLQLMIIVWTGLGVLFGMWELGWLPVKPPIRRDAPIVMLLLPLVFFGFALVHFGAARLVGRKHGPFFIDFMCQTLKAKRV